MDTVRIYDLRSNTGWLSPDWVGRHGARGGHAIVWHEGVGDPLRLRKQYGGTEYKSGHDMSWPYRVLIVIKVH